MALPTAIKTKKLKSIMADIQSLGVKQGQSEVSNYGTVMERLLDKWGVVLTDSLKESAFSHGNFTQGKNSGLINSINHTITAVGSTGTKMQIHIADYYDFVNEGVSGKIRKRDTPYSYTTKAPPRSALEEYAITKKGILSNFKAKHTGMSDKVAVQSLAKLMQRSIFLYGTKGSKFYDEIINQKNLDEFAKEFSEATGKVLVFSLKQRLNKPNLS
jgi:hypothetical protein